jgi:protein required for attachment to host cells
MLATGTPSEKGFHVFETDPKILRTGQPEERLWFVVANEKQAYIYRRTEAGALVMIAHAQDQGESIKTLDEHIVSSRVMHDHMKPVRRITFLDRLTEWLELAGKEKSYDQLVLVAAGETLALIRADLPEHLQKRIVAAVDGELTGMSIPELQSRLEYIIGSP